MAKALLGHVGAPDPRMVSEMRRLQRRIHDLESQLVRLQAENAALSAARNDEMITIDVSAREPALT